LNASEIELRRHPTGSMMTYPLC